MRHYKPYKPCGVWSLRSTAEFCRTLIIHFIRNTCTLAHSSTYAISQSCVQVNLGDFDRGMVGGARFWGWFEYPDFYTEWSLTRPDSLFLIFKSPWACAHCSLRFPFSADPSGTRCGVLLSKPIHLKVQREMLFCSKSVFIWLSVALLSAQKSVLILLWPLS